MPGIWLGCEKVAQKYSQPFSQWGCYVRGYEKMLLSTNILLRLRNDRRYDHSYNVKRIGTIEPFSKTLNSR